MTIKMIFKTKNENIHGETKINVHFEEKYSKFSLHHR